MGTILGIVVLAFLLAFVISIAEAGILYAIWKFVMLAIWPTLPTFGFWPIFWILVAINIIGSAFRSHTTVNKK